jgi:glutathione S-transferase
MPQAKGDTNMITVYGFSKVPPPVKGITRDLRVVWALEEVGLPYKLHPLDAVRGDHRGPEYAEANAFNIVPAIDDDGFKLFESGAILLYLADKVGKLLPKEAKARAIAQQWMFAALNTVEPALLEIFAIDRFYADAAWAKERRPMRVDNAKTRLGVVEKELAKRPYLAGGDFSAADILMTSVLRFVQHTDILPGLPNVAAYKARCEKRAAWEKVISEHERRAG